MKNNKPTVRFNGYSSDWGEFKMIDLVTPVVREVPKPSSSYKRLSVRSHAKGTFHQVVDDPDTVAMDKLYVVQKDDLIVNITFAWEHAIAVAGEKDHNLLVSHRFPTFLIDKSDKNFIKYLVTLNSFKNLLDLISPGGAGRNRVLNKKDFNNLKVFAPVEIDEQTQIGSFFKELDETIYLHQQELEALKQTKQGFLQKMFPKDGETVPEIRFPTFDDEWKLNKVNEIAEVNPKSTLPSEFEYVDLGSVVGTRLLSSQKETKQTAPSRAQRVAKIGDVFYQTVRPYQQNNFLFDLRSENFVFSTGYAQMRPHIDSHFLLTALQVKSFVVTVMKNCTGTSYPAINSSDLSQLEIMVPVTSEEQIKIGEFFKKLDEVIELKEKELEAFKKTKKGFLQKMFV